tara:strand:+ start:1143 stop:1268 length:126 start_codon:yes stop_codon:yes gene_type:complete
MAGRISNTIAMSVEILKFGISMFHTIAIKIAIDVIVKQIER